MKAYLAGPIFTNRDMAWNAKLAHLIRTAYPGIQLYLAQENKNINDKTKFADSKAIFDGDFARLKESDILIATISGDMPPIGTSCEVSIFSQMIQENPSANKRLICIYDDTRDMTINQQKADYAATHIAENQTCYTNLLLIGAAKRSGIVVRDEQQLFEYMTCLYQEDNKSLETSGIYCFTNRYNGKQYVGQSVNLSRRLKEHWKCRGIGHNSAIDLAIHTYGKEAFDVEILEYCDPAALNEAEERWISIKNCIAPSGYNLTKGGDYIAVLSTFKPVSCYDIQGNVIRSFDSIVEAASAYNIVPSTISFCCKMKEGYRSCADMFWAYGAEPHIDIKIPMTGSMAKQRVYCYDKNTHQLLGEYAHAKEACEKLSLPINGVSNICAACRGKFYYIYGYIWSRIKWDIAPDNFRQLNLNHYLEHRNKK